MSVSTSTTSQLLSAGLLAKLFLARPARSAPAATRLDSTSTLNPKSYHGLQVHQQGSGTTYSIRDSLADRVDHFAVIT